MLSNPDKGRTTTDLGGSSLYGDQRGGQHESVVNKCMGVLDLPVEMEASGQASGTTAGT